ncbi:MAG TPA: hypothetical protein VFJ62_04290 [Usitatibacter sp.]|nr:hypothetical protein [Usitatibacter sp.]
MNPFRRLASVALARALPAAALVAVAACGAPIEPSAPAISPGEWREFQGSWNAVGSRHAMALGGERKAAIVELRGTLLLAGPGRPGVGFRSDVIALSDSATGLAGRSVWTDEHGDQVFSELTGEGTAARNRITGKIVGGTGRYAGATGDYEFAWEYVIEADEGTIEGRAVGLKGRVRAGSAAGAASK